MRPCPFPRTPVGKTGISKVAGMAETHRFDMPGTRESAMIFNGSKKKEVGNLGSETRTEHS